MRCVSFFFSPLPNRFLFTFWKFSNGEPDNLLALVSFNHGKLLFYILEKSGSVTIPPRFVLCDKRIRRRRRGKDVHCCCCPSSIYLLLLLSFSMLICFVQVSKNKITGEETKERQQWRHTFPPPFFCVYFILFFFVLCRYFSFGNRSGLVISLSLSPQRGNERN